LDYALSFSLAVFRAMAAVDHMTQAVRQAEPADTKAPEFSCTACNEHFATPLEHRAHFKSERHVYNTKRKHAGLKPISQEAWERKLRESRGAATEQKGTAHLKAKEEKPRGVPGAFGPGPREGAGSEDASEDTATERPLTPRGCLFDRKHFDSVDLCLAYMERSYSFFIPDQEYCIDVPKFLTHLGTKITEDYACINCNRRFPDLASVRRHMVDKGHTQLTSEAKTRRGNYDKDGTAGLEDEMEPFFDFTGSVRDVADKINNPKQKVASILRFFDIDRDGKLDPLEVAGLWSSINDGAKLSDTQYQGACALCDADPKDGLDVQALSKLYESEFADLDDHFTKLQDLLIAKKRKPLKGIAEGDEDVEDGESEDGDDDDDDLSEDQEFIECEDDDEFEEVMRILGLQPVKIMDTGDLRLPNGNVATHRDVSYIYKQRGVRSDDKQLALAEGGGGVGKAKRQWKLMLGHAARGECRIAMTKRQQATGGKQLIAFVKRQNAYITRTGMAMNVVNHAKKRNITTGRGDCSNGR